MFQLILKSKAFTLIEMMLTIAIISILFALGVATVNSIRMKAHEVACLSNMREIGRGVLFYTQENDGRYPPHYGGFQTKEGGRTLVWYGHIAPYATDWDMSFYTPMASIFYCPANKIANPQSGVTYASTAEPAVRKHYSYGYNYYHLTTLKTYYPNTRSISINNLSSLVLISEIPNIEDESDSSPFPPNAIDLNEGNLAQYPAHKPELSHRHEGRSNIVFADGHAEPRYIKKFLGEEYDIYNWRPRK